MRQLRRVAVALAAASLVAATLAPALEASAATAVGPVFTDIGGSGEASAITALYQTGIINGVGNNQFGPQTLVTRAEMAKIVVNLIGEATAATALADETPSYKDASAIPTWAWGYVNVASDLGILHGFPDGTFQPNGYVTYAQAAAILLRAEGDDHPGVIVGAWPGNYVLAALRLGLSSGVSTFQANLPATRGDIAQMAYNAATKVPVASAVAGSSPLVWTTSGGKPSDKLGADRVVSGLVTAADADQVTLSASGGAVTYALATSYALQGASSVVDLVNQGATLVLDANGNVTFLAPDHQVQAASGTLVSVNSNGDSALTLADGTTVAYDANTQFYVNTPSTGLGTDANAAVAGADALRPGDGLLYTLQSTGDAASVFATNSTIVNGLVLTTCSSNCTANPNGVGTVTVQFAGTQASGQDTVTVQPYTQITVNGQVADLADLASGDVVNVAVVGGNGQNGVAAQGQTLAQDTNAANSSQQGTSQPGLGDGNAVAITATSETLSGKVTAITIRNGVMSSFLLDSQTAPVAVDAQWVAPSGFGVNADVLVYLDGSGEARWAEVTSAAALGAVGVVTASTQTTTTSGTTYQYALSTASGTTTISTSSAQAGISGTDVPVFEGGTASQPTLTPMTQVSGTWTVVPNTEAAGAVTVTNGVTQTTITTPGAVFNDAWGYLGYTGLQNDDAVDVYQVSVGGTPYFVIHDTSR